MKKVFIVQPVVLRTRRKKLAVVNATMRLLGAGYEEARELDTDIDLCVFAPNWNNEPEGNMIWDWCKENKIPRAEYYESAVKPVTADLSLFKKELKEWWKWTEQ